MRPSACILLSAFLPAAAFSQSTGDVDRARELFESGNAAAEQGRWADACQAYAESYQLSPRSSSLINLAAAQAQAGRLVEALASYHHLAERHSTDADAEVLSAAAQAAQAIERRVAHVRVHLSGLLTGDSVIVDGAAVDGSQISNPFSVNAGVHEIRVVRRAEIVGRAEVILEESETREVTLDLPSNAAAPAQAGREGAIQLLGEPRSSAAPASTDRGRPKSKRRGLWIGLGLGAAAVVAASVTAAVLVSSGGSPPPTGTFGVGRFDVR